MLSSTTLLLASTAALFSSDASGALITDDSYFYGQSPAVYPSPIANGTGDWAAAYVKANAFVGQLTLEEKVNLTFGVTSTTGCSGFIPAISRLGFPGICLNDAGNGVRATDFVSGFAGGMSVGASWNKQLAYKRGLAMGAEFYKKGVQVALGPVVGPLARVVESGRHWEGMSFDPWLSGVLAAATVTGVQESGVQTSVKHFIGNEQETHRTPLVLANGTTLEATSSNIDDKTMHELYLWPFADCVKAGTTNIMCSYNRLNNSYACANSKTLNGILKEELGFQGFVVSDWGAQHSGVASSLAGLDMAMSDGGIFWGPNSTLAVNNGTVPESRVTDQATRIIASWYKLGQDSDNTPSPGVGMPILLTEDHEIIDARDPAANVTTFEGAVEGHVLVKNTGSLPLKKPKQIAIFGYSAKTPDTFDVPAPGDFLGAWGGSLEAYNASIVLDSFLGTTFNASEVPQIAPNGTIITGGGSGGNTPSYFSSPFDALSQRAYKDGTALFWDLVSQDPVVPGNSNPCLVFINAFASEGLDRSGIADDYSDQLVNNVADACSNTIVVIHNAGVRLVEGFVDHPNVTAIIYAHTPGQDSGFAITSLLYGEKSFSGKLPYAVAKRAEDYGALLNPDLPEGDNWWFPQSDFIEGVYVDYKAFNQKNITPRYEFGFGLTYTNFTYSSLAISNISDANTDVYPTGPIQEGGQVDLWDVLYTVNATITNTGSVAGAEIAQLYVGIAGGPAKQLRGFEKVDIDSGASAAIGFELKRRDLSEWDVVAQKWKLQAGNYGVWVGASSRDLRLAGSITI